MISARRTWVMRIGAAFGLWLVVCVAGFLLGNQPRPGLVALVIATAAAVLWLYLDTSAESEPPRWRLVDDEPIRPRGEDARLALFQRAVTRQLESRDVSDQLQRHLAAVTEQRLLTKHGISRLADPQRAARMLGPELAGFLDQARPPRLSLTQIDQLLKRIEAL